MKKLVVVCAVAVVAIAVLIVFLPSSRDHGAGSTPEETLEIYRRATIEKDIETINTLMGLRGSWAMGQEHVKEMESVTEVRIAKVERIADNHALASVIFTINGHDEEQSVQLSCIEGKWYIDPFRAQQDIATNERNVYKALKAIRDAEQQFRDRDLDRSGVKDYWVLDVSGLFRTLDAAGNAVALIDREIAIADAHPSTAIAGYVGASLTPKPVAYAGYYFVAMTRDETASSYLTNRLTEGQKTPATNSRKFGFCAYPMKYESTGKHTFIVNNEGTVLKKDMGFSTAVTTWPMADIHVAKSLHWQFCD